MRDDKLGKIKEPTRLLRVERVWRDDAIIYPDGRREGAWVECKVYQPESVPENRDGYVSTNRKVTPDQEGVERLADLWYRLVEKETLEGKRNERGDDDD